MNRMLIPPECFMYVTFLRGGVTLKPLSRDCKHFPQKRCKEASSWTFESLSLVIQTSVPIAACDSSCKSQLQPNCVIFGKRLMGGQNVSCDFWGEKTYHRVRPPKPCSFGGLRKWDLPGVPVSSKENNRAKTNGGGKTYHRWGGPKPFLERGFMVCFPLP